MITTKQKGLVYGAFIGDALALGPHWVYDTTKLDGINFKEGYQKPMAAYHSSKEKGDFTHYGDQTLLLLEHVAIHKKLDIQVFKNDWLNFTAHHVMYMDKATKETIHKISESDAFIGSNSDELGGFTRCAALFALDYVTLDDLIAQTQLTHSDEHLRHITEFTYKLLKQILSGKTPSEALDILYEGTPKDVKEYIDQASLRLDDPAIPSVMSLGQSCASSHSFPSALYLIYKYEESFEEALIHNVLAGGDSAARGMFIGMVLGAYHGFDSLPATWINGINAKDRIDKALKTLTLI